MKKVDVIIVGQGIAGTVLAEKFLNENKSVAIIDEKMGAESSFIAAGLVNPIVFRRITKTWNVDKLLPSAETSYSRLEKMLSKSIFHKLPIYRIFNGFEEANDWSSRMMTDGFSDYLQEGIKELKDVNTPFGYGIVTKGGWVDLKTLLKEFRNWIKDHAILLEEKVDFNNLIISGEGVEYKEITADKIIFAEGVGMINNPYFSWLPLVPNKGEVMTVKMNEVESTGVLNKKCFALPLGEGNFRVGATFDWKKPFEREMDKGRDELLEKLEKISGNQKEIVEQDWGIRPTVPDRKPMIGEHPELQNVLCFNGMGTKGVLLAPFLAENLYNYMFENEEIIPEANLQRFIKKHFKK